MSSGFRRLVLISSFYFGYSVISNAIMFFMQSLNDVPVINLDGFILRVNFGVRKKKEKLGVKIEFCLPACLMTFLVAVLQKICC